MEKRLIKPLKKNSQGNCSISLKKKELKKLEIEEGREEDTYLIIKKLEVEE